MSMNLGTKTACSALAAAAVAFSFAPAAQATPINYDFSVHVNSGSLSGTTENGSFAYDSSSIIPGGTNSTAGLLTALDFTLNGIAYDANSANTGFLSFNAAGDLTGFLFGNNCVAGRCGLISRGDSWFARTFGRTNNFTYTAVDSLGRPSAGVGNVSYSLAPVSVPVPEPGTLGLFGLGALLIGLFLGVRRRMW